MNGVDPSVVSLIIQMSQKYRADYVSKSNPLNTPYIQLLDAKKKLYGYKYELVKQEKVDPPRKNSSGNSSLFTQSRPYKSFSNQKARPSKTQNSRKKRMYTEQADEPSGMHESLNIPPTHEATHHASKSLFYPQISHEQPTQVIEFIQNFTNPLHKNRKDSKISNHSKGSQDSPDKNNPLDKGQPYHTKTDLSSLNIQDIDSLLTLIDNCVQEANQYITFLSQKIQLINIELNRLKASLQYAQSQLKIKNSLVLEKEKQIDTLKKQPGVTYEGLTSNEAKKLIDMIEKVNHENDILRKKVEVLTMDSKESRKKHSNDIFNQIHSKIDVLNIAIDNKGNNQGTHPHERRHKHSKSKQN